MKNEHKIFIILSAFLAVFSFFPAERPAPLYQKETALLKISNEKTNLAATPPSLFPAIELEAKAVYVFDLANNKEIFAKNSEAQLPLASLAKLMTAVVARESLESDFAITISKEALNQEGDNGFSAGEKWLLDDLIDIMLVSSSNDAAYAVAASGFQLAASGSNQSYQSNQNDKFIELMNKKAKELNLEQTFFLNETGLDVNSETSGVYGSAKDITFLIKYILENEPEILAKTREESFLAVSLGEKPRDFENTNKIVNKIPGFIAGKTGYTDLAGGNLAIVFDAGFNHPIIAVVLGSSFEGRFNDMEKLVAASYD